MVASLISFARSSTRSQQQDRCGQRRFLVTFTLICIGLLQQRVDAIQDTADSREWRQPTLNRVGPFATSRYVSNQWGGVSVDIGNPNDRPALLQATSFFDESASQFYRREIWVPAQSRRSASYSVFFPPEQPTDSSEVRRDPRRLSSVGDQTVLHSTLLDVTDGRDIAVPFNGQLVPAIPVITSKRATRCGVFRDKVDDSQITDWIFAAQEALVVDAGRTREAFEFSPQNYPASHLQLDVYDCLVIASNQIAADPIALRAIRNWLVEGGSAWVMLDQTSPETLEQLLGTSNEFEWVDRVSVNQLDFETLADDQVTVIQTDSYFHEEPVEFVRVVADQRDVSVRCHGWPAAFWMQVGKGRILITTIGAKGWLEERQGEQLSFAPEKFAQYSTNAPLRKLIGDLLPADDVNVAADPKLPEYASQLIGYRIVSRWMIALVLGGFLVAMTVAGVVLARRDRLRVMAWVTPSTAIALAAGLVLFGSWYRNSIPSTVAEIQHIQWDRSGDFGVVQGTTALYFSGRKEMVISGAGESRIQRSEPSNEQELLDWEKHDVWSQQVRFGPGTDFYQYRSMVVPKQPLRLSAHFEGDQLVGRLQSDLFAGLSDPVLVSGAGVLPVTNVEGKSFAISAVETLKPGDYLADGFLSTEQERRREVYQRLLGGDRLGSHREATFLFWTNAIDCGMKTPTADRCLGQALCEVPLHLSRTPPNTEVIIGTPWLELSARSRGGGFASFYGRQKREWVESERSTDAILAFRLPETLLPFQLQSARIEMELRVEGRLCQISLLPNANEVLLHDQQQASGRLTFEIDQPSQLELSPEGEFLIGFRVGDAAVGEAINDWRIRDVQVTLSGITQAIE